MSPRTQKPRHEDPLVMPENHLDMVVVPDSVDPNRAASLRTRIIAVVSMPLFFIVAFVVCYVSATHAPAPHDMALTVAGPAAVTQQLADAIDEKAPHGFDVTQTTDSDAARHAVTDRSAVGAIIVDGNTVTTVIASGGGRLAAQVVQSVGQQVAEQLGGTVKVTDVAPLPSDDPGGSVLFFFLVVCTVGGFLCITVISQVIPKIRARSLIATSVGAAVLVPVIGFAMISVYVDFEVNFGTIAGMLGVGMVYTFTVGLLASLFTLLLGNGSVLMNILFLVALNFPSAGGTAPESMLPPFWQVVHNLWVGSGAFESMRSILFFDGAQFGRWFARLVIWTGAALVLLIVVAVLKKRQAGEVAATAAELPTPGDDRSPHEPRLVTQPAGQADTAPGQQAVVTGGL
jgi:hypothetical protein